MKGLGKFVTEFMSTDGAVPPTEADWAAALLTDKPPALTVAADATINPAADDEQPATTVDEKSPEYACARLKLIHEDIAAAQKNLVNIPDAYRRGLSLETLKFFGCGYLPAWTSTKSRIKGSHSTTTPRLIIPTPNHYLARLTVPLEDFPEAQREYIRLKPHEGSKDSFGLYDALNQISRNPNLFLTVTEGEIDAMSIWQACAVPVVATSGADSWKRTLTNLETRGEYAGNFKLRVLILYDPDDTGREAASKFRAALMSAGIPAVEKFLSPEVCKLDANQILCEQGEAALREIFAKLTENIDEEFVAAENEIAARKETPAIKQAGDSDFERVHNLEQGIKPSTSSGSGNLRDYDDEPPELVQAKILAILDSIDPRSLTRNQWLAVMTALKSLGVDYAVADAFNQRDPDRYDERANLATWNSLTEHYGVEVLAARARDFGFDFKEFYRQWFREHPEYSKRQPARRNNRPVAREYSAADDAAAQPKFSPYYIPPEIFDTLLTFRQTDKGDMRRLLLAFGDRLRYLPDKKNWGIYTGSLWKITDGETSTLYPFARAMSDFIEENVPPEPAPADSSAPEAERKKAEAQRVKYNIAQKLDKRWQERKTMTAAIDLLKGADEIFITREDLNREKNLLNCINGVVDLHSGKLYPHAPELYLTQQTRAVYRPGYHNETVDNFLASTIPNAETRAGLLSLLGYSITGEPIREKFGFIWGRGGNGKGTLTSTLVFLLKDYACSLPSELFLVNRPRDPNAPSPALAMLTDVRLAVVEELPPDARWDIAFLKRLTGRDPLPARSLYENFQTFVTPTWTIFLSGNHEPRIADVNDDGFKRRLVRINFDREFSDVVGSGGMKPDCYLKDKLRTEEALSGLLTVLVESAGEYYKDGLIISSEMAAAAKSYLAENDVVSIFVRENCRYDDERQIPYSEFRDRLISRAGDDFKKLSPTYVNKLIDAFVLGDNRLQKIKPQNRPTVKGLAWNF